MDYRLIKIKGLKRERSGSMILLAGFNKIGGVEEMMMEEILILILKILMERMVRCLDKAKIQIEPGQEDNTTKTIVMIHNLKLLILAIDPK